MTTTRERCECLLARRCVLHTAALDLLEALVAMHDAFWGTSHSAAEDAANALAKAAIAKAEGVSR